VFCWISALASDAGKLRENVATWEPTFLINVSSGQRLFWSTSLLVNVSGRWSNVPGDEYARWTRWSLVIVETWAGSCQLASGDAR
jgi:hypothetical protein